MTDKNDLFSKLETGHFSIEKTAFLTVALKRYKIVSGVFPILRNIYIYN